MNTNVGIFAKQIAKYDILTYFVSNFTKSNHSINNISTNIRLIKVKNGLNHLDYYKFLFSQIPKIGWVWLYRGRSYCWSTALLVKAFNGKVIVKLDSMGGLSTLTRFVMSLFKKHSDSTISGETKDDRNIAYTKKKLLAKFKSKGIAIQNIAKLLRAVIKLPKIIREFIVNDFPIIIADAVLCETPNLQSELGNLNRKGKCYLYSNSVVLSEMCEREKSFTEQGLKKENIVLSVGRIIPSKGFENAIHVYSQLPQQTSQSWKMIIVGPIEDREYYQALLFQIKKLNLEYHISIIPGLYGDELLKLYFRSRIFFMTYPGFGRKFGIEGQPNVVVEAMFFRNAILVSNSGSVAHLLKSGQNGLLFPVDNYEHVTDLLSNLMNDTTLVDKYGHSARKYVEKHLTFENNSSQLLKKLIGDF